MAQKRNSALIFIFITMLIDVIGFGIVIPVFPKLITQLTGGDLANASQVGGWLMAAYAIMQFVCSPIIGGLSDAYGRRPVILAALFAFGCDYFLQGFAPTLGWLYVGRILAGVTGASFTAAGAYIADISTPEKRAQNFGLIGAAFGVGFIIGPALGGGISLIGDWLAETYPKTIILGYDMNHWGVRLPFFASGLLALINWLYGFFILPESLKAENRRPFDWKRANPVGSLKQLSKNPIVGGFVLPLILIYIAMYATQGVWSFYTMERFGWDAKMVGISLAVVGIMAGLVQGGLTRIALPKLGTNKSIYIGLTVSAIGNALYGFATAGWMMFAIIAVASLGGISMPAMQGIMSNAVPPNEQGELRGALTSLMSLTSIIGPPIMSNLFAFFNDKNSSFRLPGGHFFVAGFLILISVFLIYRLLSQQKTTQKVQ